MEKECGKMREFKNRRNPILPLEFHIPDSEAHVMPDGKLYLYDFVRTKKETSSPPEQ